MLDRPEVFDHLVIHWQGFWELHCDRPISMGGASAIPFVAIDRYCSRYRIDGADEFDRFRRIMRQMDGEFLKWSRKKRPETK